MTSPTTPDIHFHQGDLPDSVQFKDSVAVDTEAMGLNIHRDQLCVVQLSAGDGVCHVVQLDRKTYNAPNLKRVLGDPNLTKIFHFARFDVKAISKYLGVMSTPLYCTKIASKLSRTYTDKHGLKDLCLEILGIEISKLQQTSDWGARELTPEQLTYAATDVLYLHKLKANLEEKLEREGRTQLAQDCFEFLPVRARLDTLGFVSPDIFQH